MTDPILSYCGLSYTIPANYLRTWSSSTPSAARPLVDLYLNLGRPSLRRRIRVGDPWGPPPFVLPGIEARPGAPHAQVGPVRAVALRCDPADYNQNAGSKQIGKGEKLENVDKSSGNPGESNWEPLSTHSIILYNLHA